MSDRPPFVDEKAALLRRHRGYVAMGMAPWFVALGTVLGALLTRTPAFLVATPHLLILGAVSLLYVLRSNPSPHDVPGGITLDGSALRAGGERIADRDELAQGFVVPDGGKTTVRLERRGKLLPLTVRVRDVAAGDRLLEALELGPRQTAARVRILGGFADWSLARQLVTFLGPMLIAFALGGVGALLLHPAAFVALLVPYAIGTVAFALAPRTMDIGADGLRLRWLGREELIRFGDVAAIRVEDVHQGGKDFRVLTVRWRMGGERRITLTQKGWNDDLSGAIEERVRSAFAAHQELAAGPGEDARGALARRSRDVGTWVTNLRRLGAGGAEGPRGAVLPREALLGVIENPTEPDADRAAAAIALREGAAPADRRRMRIAARSSASPKLRVALETAADEAAEAEAIEEALLGVAPEARAERRDH